jgi:mRNA-degrading endonuclease toxin of MazEF toxin-antitoxin module
MKPLRGQIYEVDFDSMFGLDERGLRPAPVISSDFFNSRIDSVVVVAITSQDRSKHPGCVAVARSAVASATAKRGLDLDSYAIAHSPLTLPQVALGPLLGTIRDLALLAKISDALAFALDLAPALDDEVY